MCFGSEAESRSHLISRDADNAFASMADIPDEKYKKRIDNGFERDCAV